MTKQRPDPEKIANELSAGSLFFGKRPAPAAAESAPPVPEQTLPSDVVTSRRHDVATPNAPPPDFDINRESVSRDSLRLSADEVRAVEELKSALKWDFDLVVSKNDICRVALHDVLEDFRAKGASSAVVKRLKKKLGRQ